MRTIRALASLAFLSVACIHTAAQAATETYLFDGSGLPDAHGWLLDSGAGHLGGSVTVIPQTGGGPADVLEVETTGMQFHLYSYATGYGEFLLTTRVKVESSGHNFADAGFQISVFGDYGSPDRLNSFYVTPGEVGFMDDGASATTTVGVFHDYSVLYRAGTVSLFVDTPSDQILGGTATALLSRSGAFHSAGVVAFGDGTNDEDLNSHYILDDVRLVGLAPVPELPTSLLLGAGVVALGALGRRHGRR